MYLKAFLTLIEAGADKQRRTPVRQQKTATHRLKWREQERNGKWSNLLQASPSAAEYLGIMCSSLAAVAKGTVREHLYPLVLLQ